MNRHRTDRVALVCGIVFLALACCWIVARFVDVPFGGNLPGLGWAFAILLVVIGVAGLLGALRAAGRGGGRSSE